MLQPLIRRLFIIVIISICNLSGVLYAAPFTPPQITNLNNDEVTFTEGGGAILLDAGGNAGVTAGNAPDFNQALLTVTIVGGLHPGEDVLGLFNEGNAPGQIGIFGHVISYGGTAIGTFTGGTSIRRLKIRFNASATITAISALLRQVTYYNSNPIKPATTNRFIRYELSDGYGGVSSPATVTLKITTINHAPVATSESYSLNVNTTLSVGGPGVLFNDFDLDGDAMAAILLQLPLHGSVSLTNSGFFSYTPNSGFQGLDSFVYRVYDPSGAFIGNAAALLLVGSNNLAPQPVADTYTINENEGLFITNPYNGSVLQNDTDPNSGVIRICNKASLFTAPVNGQMTLYPNGTFRYMPNAGFSGTETFVYRNCDAQGACANMTSSILVQAINNAPDAADDYYEVAHLSIGTGNLLWNDLDADGDAKTTSLITSPVHGNIVLNTDGSFNYTPNSSFGGVDRIIYQVCDNGTLSKCDTAIAVFNVSNENIQPGITTPATIPVTEDLASPLTGIQFSDADALTGAITATLAVAGGALSATSGSGVTISGSGTSSLTMNGALGSVNAFIAAGNITYTTALNTISNVQVTITINDNGNTGTGGAKTATANTTLIVQPVNDAPVITTPGTQTTFRNQVLTLNTANGNTTTVSDVDAGAGNLQVTITATHGRLTLSSTAGLVFQIGSGTSDVTMTFTGALSDINNTLKTIWYSPNGNYTGSAVIAFTINDQGNTGTGGSQTTTASIPVVVAGVAPVITTVHTTNADGMYKTGDAITITVAFDQAVTLNLTGGSPALLLETGGTGQQAAYVSGSGTNTLTFVYTVQAGDVSVDLDYATAGALTLHGATLQNAWGDDAIITLPAPGSSNSLAGQHSIVIDAVAPAITGTTRNNASPSNATTLSYTITFSKVVTGVDVTDFSLATISGNAAGVVSAINPLNATTYIATINSITGAGTLRLDANSSNNITDAAGNALAGGITGEIYDIDHLAPQVNISTTAAGIISTPFTVTFTFTENVTGFGVNDLQVNNCIVSAYTALSGSVYTVQVTPVTDGILQISLPANRAFDRVGNGNQASPVFAITTDISAPSVTIALPAETTQPFTATIRFSEAVNGFTINDISYTNALLSNLTAIAPGAYTVQVTPLYGGTVKLWIAARVATDVAGNLNSASTEATTIAYATYTIEKVFPNPAGKYVYIRLNGIVGREINVRLTDMQGRIVLGGYMPVNNNLITVNVTRLQPGAYILMVRNIGTHSFKILVTR